MKTEDTADATSTSKIEKEAVIAGNKEITSLQKKVEDRTAEISLLTGRLQSMESTNSQLSDEVKEKQEEKDDLMKHFETIKGKLQVKIQEGFAKTARLVEVEKERDEVTRHLAEMSVQCEELETMLRETSSEIVQVETQKLMYMGEVQIVKDELAQLVREREEERKKEDEKREKDKEDAKIREEEEEKMKERREADIRDKDIKQNDAEKERALERDEAVRSAEERRLMQLDLTEISNKLHQSLEDHRLQGERVLAMEAEKLKFHGHAEELKREIEESRARSTALDGQLANISSALTNSEQVAIAGNKEITSLQKKVEDRTAEISLLTGRLQSMESTNSQLSDEVKEKQEEKDDLMKHFETIKGKLQVKIQEGFAKTARLVEVEKERDEVTRHLAEMSVQCEELETMLRETSSEIVQVETQKLMYMGEVQIVKDELAQLVREREEERKKEDEKKVKEGETEESLLLRVVQEKELREVASNQISELQKMLESKIMESQDSKKDFDLLTLNVKEKESQIEKILMDSSAMAAKLKETEEMCSEAVRRADELQAIAQTSCVALKSAEKCSSDLDLKLQSLITEKDEYEKVKERTKQTVATLLEKLKHFKALAESKTEEVITLESESQRMKEEFKKYTEDSARREVEMKQKDTEILSKEGMFQSQSADSDTLKCLLTSLETAMKEKEEESIILQNKLLEYTALMKEKENDNMKLTTECKEMKVAMERRTLIFEKLKAERESLKKELNLKEEQLSDLRGKLEESASTVQKNEKHLQLAQEDLSVLSLRYVQTLEEKTAAIAAAAEEKAIAARCRDERDEMRIERDKGLDKGRMELTEAVSAVEDRDARLSSYSDHVEGLEQKLKGNEEVVTKLQSDVQDIVKELLQVRSSYPRQPNQTNPIQSNPI